jgi:hypothetical protein
MTENFILKVENWCVRSSNPASAYKIQYFYQLNSADEDFNTCQLLDEVLYLGNEII